MLEITRWKSCMRTQNKLAAQITLYMTPAILVCLIGLGVSSAQTQNTRYSAESLAVKSRAEQAAEQQVALSPEKIVELLRQEPGLLLQVKKMLVRKAYEQGRILDPEDLTDDALFRLLHEDHNICVLATREIEDRAYVRAKPTLEEIERHRELDARVGLTRAVVPETEKPQGGAHNYPSQEDAYWEKHDGSLEQYRIGQPQSQPQETRPTTPSVPQTTPAIGDSQRQVEMTGLPQNSDSYDSMGVESGAPVFDSGVMTRIAPEQLPGLLTASSSSTLNTATLDGSASIRGRSGVPNPSYGASLSAGSPAAVSMNSPQRAGADFAGRTAGVELQSKLENPRRQIPSPEDLNLDRPQIRRHANPYANIPSLYDLYSQVSPRPAVLEQFGANIFRNGTGNLDNLPMDLPAGPDYVLGPGDGVNIDIWGGVAQRLQRVVDRSGR
jgi:hypothetical protein